MKILICLVCVLLLSLTPVLIHMLILMHAGQSISAASEIGSPDFVLVGVVISADGIGRLLNRIHEGVTKEEARGPILGLLLLFALSLLGIGCYVVFRSQVASTAQNPTLLWIIGPYFVFSIIGAIGAILLEGKPESI